MHMKHCKRKYPDKMSIYSLNTKSNSQKGEGLTQLTWNKESEVGVTVLPQQLCAPAMGWLTLAPVRNGLLLTPWHVNSSAFAPLARSNVPYTVLNSGSLVFNKINSPPPRPCPNDSDHERDHLLRSLGREQVRLPIAGGGLLVSPLLNSLFTTVQNQLLMWSIRNRFLL